MTIQWRALDAVVTRMFRRPWGLLGLVRMGSPGFAWSVRVALARAGLGFACKREQLGFDSGQALGGVAIANDHQAVAAGQELGLVAAKDLADPAADFVSDDTVSDLAGGGAAETCGTIVCALMNQQDEIVTVLSPPLGLRAQEITAQ